MRHYTIGLAGPVPSGLLLELRRRWGDVSSRPQGSGMELRCALHDDAGLRSLLSLLWDASLTVTAVAADQGPPQDGT